MSDIEIQRVKAKRSVSGFLPNHELKPAKNDEFYAGI